MKNRLGLIKSIGGGLNISGSLVTGSNGGGNGGVVLPQVASASLLLNLQSDSLSLNNNDLISVWPDLSGNGIDFSASGTQRPTFLSNYVGYPAVWFNNPFEGGNNVWMEAPNADFADNLPSFSVFSIAFATGDNDQLLLMKNQDSSTNRGWITYSAGGQGFTPSIRLATSNADIFLRSISETPDLSSIITYECVSFNELHIYINKNLGTETQGKIGIITTTASINPVGLGRDAVDTTLAFDGWMRAIMLYAPAPNSIDRVAIVTWLANRYGITI